MAFQFTWTKDMIRFLIALRDGLHMDLPTCALNMKREFGHFNFTRQSCGAAYSRAKKRGEGLTLEEFKEIKGER